MNFSADRPEDVGGSVEAGGEILGEALSRRQLEIRVMGDHLAVRNVGRCPMWVNSALTARARVGPGDTIHLQQQIMLLCVSARRHFVSLAGYPSERLGAFGMADQDGLVGESSAAWNLRRQLDVCAQSEGNVLILGKSGSGKDLVAHALHHLSPQKNNVFVAENMSTTPPGLAPAILFGNRKNFPNPGMDDRVGLVGMADGGMLFLDEIGDMSNDVQPMLLRVMQNDGEYMRLGDEAQPRRARVRFLAATNHPERLRPELRRRFQHEIQVPDMAERREDIPLLIRHMMLVQAQRGQRLGKYIENGEPRIDPFLLDQLVRHSYSTEIAELEFLLGQAAAAHEEPVLLPLAQDVLTRRTRISEPGEGRTTAVPSRPVLPTPEEAQRAIDAEQGSVRLAAARLGISRYQLYRLIQQHGLVAKRMSDEDGQAD